MKYKDMSKRSNNRFVTGNKNIEQTQSSKDRKCAHHIYSQHYAANMRQHDEIMRKAEEPFRMVDMDSSIVIKIVFHFLAPKGSYNRDRVLSRVHDVVMSLNDDFNNYTNNPNTMNNFKYKSIINQVFISNMAKQNIYLGPDYIKFLPTKPSNITFELGEIYYYPVKNRLNLGQYDDVKDVEIEHQVIKQYIHHNRADAINPEKLLNIWIIDMVETSILGFSNFPWEICDNYHGVIINRKCFFQEDYGETNFSLFKTFTHEIGHYLGLLHVFSHNSGLGAYAASNMNADSERITDTNGNYIAESPDQLDGLYDPTDKIGNRRLHFDNQYNPLFMNFMDYTYDKYVSMFTQNQIQKMRYMLLTYRPKLNYIINKVKLPIPKYNPDTDTILGDGKQSNNVRNPPLIPSHEVTNNPRLAAQGFAAQGFALQPPQNPSISMTPQNPMEVNAAQWDTYSNSKMIAKLIPNLSANNITHNVSNNSREQVIENIQSNLPPDPSVIAAAQLNAYDNMIKKYQLYNSDDSYAKNYPYDPYTMQHSQNNMGLLQQRYQLQDEILRKQAGDPNSGNGGAPENSVPSLVYSTIPASVIPKTGVSDPRMQTYDPRMQTYDPRMQTYDPRMQTYDPRMQTYDPRMQTYDPRMQTYDPRMQTIDPRMQTIDPRFTQQIDPRYIMNPVCAAPMDPRLMPKISKEMEKKTKRVDPQIKKMDEKKKNECRIMENRIEEELSDSDDEINHEAVKNLRSQRIYPKYAQAKPETKKNSLDPKYKSQPSNLKEIAKMKNKQKITELVSNNPAPIMNHVPIHMALPQNQTREIEIDISDTMIPSDIVDKIDRIDENIQNIKAKIPISIKQNASVVQPIPTKQNAPVVQPIPTSQILAKISQNDGKLKFNKYGQTVNPTVNNKFNKMDITCTPKKKFIRSKPLNLN
jgi:hypothetical protein